MNENDSTTLEKVYTYFDKSINRKSMRIIQNGQVKTYTSYDYDNLNRLWHVYENGSTTPTATYSYDANGNRSTLAYANGDTATYHYNLANKLTQLTNNNGATVLSNYTYTYYLNGNQSNKTENTTGKTNDYVYDGLGRLGTETETVSGNATATAYTYDDANNRATMNVAGTTPYTVAYAYDSNNRLTTQSKVIGDVTQKTTYGYDNNGNQISSRVDTVQPAVSGQQEIFSMTVSGQSADSNAVTFNQYDGFNQLVGTTVGDKTLTYTYDGDGLRGSKTVNGATTNYVWDGDQIALETDGSGNVTNKYLRGVNLIASDDGLEVRKYFNYNGHGDVVQLTNTTGAVEKSYEYDAFGIEKNPDAADTNAFRYAGEYFDKETGTIYLRARYYDPRIGRFISEDSVWGSEADPLSLNLYTYVYNNPINLTDPSGHIGVNSDGTIYMADGDTELDRQLLQLKIDYSKNGADTSAIAAQAGNLRADNPNIEGETPKWHVSADKSLDYYTVTEITDKLNNTMKEAESKYGIYRFAPDAVDFARFYFLVRNHGPYDLKNHPDWQHEQFMYNGEIVDKDVPGNICYGYLGKAMGFEDITLHAGAGFAQWRAGTSKKEWRNFDSFGDDPRDTARINQGIQIFKNTHSWIWW